MEQFVKVLKIRNLPIDTDFQAKQLIEMAITDYEIIPFIPLRYKLHYHEQFLRTNIFSHKEFLKKNTGTRRKEEIRFSKFWIENMKKISREFYFGKKRKFKNRITFKNKRFKLLSKYTEHIFSGNLSMIAEDIKSEMIAKILLKDYENETHHFILIDILAIRPLTFSEYISLFIRYPETSDFINAALGFSYEKLFNEIFEHNTKVSFPLTISLYLADIKK
jgi:hypothetical protein